MKPRGEPDADRTARREAPGRRNRSGHYGGQDRDRRDHRNTSAKIRSSTQREGGRKIARRKSLVQPKETNRPQGRSRSMGPRMTDQAPKSAPIPQLQLEQLQIQQVMQGALRGGLPQLYANGFGIAQTASDVSVVLITNGNPTGVLSMSYITAKSLLADLGRAVSTFETAVKSPVKTSAEIDVDLKKLMENQNAKKL